MKIITNLFTILLISHLSLHATGPTDTTSTCTDNPSTQDLSSSVITESSGPTDIVGLQGLDCAGNAIYAFKIKSLPLASQGILYLSDGTTAVTVDQVLTGGQASSLKFDPADGFVGDVKFTYVSIDRNNGNIEDTTPATVTIPITGGACVEVPTTDDKTNTNILNSSAAIDIINLSGTDCANNTIATFKITELPTAAMGILYMADGVTPVTINQTVTKAEADGFKFDPVAGFVGDAIFTYASIDANNREDATPATVTIPVIAGNGGGNPGLCNQAPITDNKANSNILNSAAAVDIINLSGTDCALNTIAKFKITELPTAAMGILYMADGVTPVTINQTVTKAEADGFKFDPADGFVGDAIFTYASIDVNNREDATPATVTIPVISGNCAEAPETDNKTNDSLENTLGAVNILNLSGTDCGGNNVEKFKIKTLPDTEAGTLYMADGVTEVTIGQVLTKAEADGLKFDPTAGFVGYTKFTYASIDTNNREDTSPATVTIPVTEENAGDCAEAPETDNKKNDKLLNTLPAVNILNLSGSDCGGDAIEKFKIKSLPDARTGVLYMADGVTAVTVGQELTKKEADGLKFDPAEDFVGEATFTYASIDADNREDATPATVTIPVTNGNGGRNGGGNCAEAPVTDDKRNVNLSNRALAVDIIDLSGTDCAGNDVEKFKIVTLPDTASGRLYMADGVTPVEVGQVLTGEEFRDLRFDPADGFVGDAIFTYAAIDRNDREDATPATVTLPIVAGAGGACTEDPTTNNIANPNMAHNLAAVDIVNLEGLNCEGEEVERFRIATLPTAEQGVLYMADGVTAVTVGQILTREEANGLRFDPADNFVGDATFSYSAIDANNRIDTTPATVTIPVIHPNGVGDNCTCKAYETSVPSVTPIGLILMFIFTLFVARRKFN